MSWFTDLFSSGVSQVIDSVGKAIDENTTSDEEREKIKLALTKELNDFKSKQLTAQADYDKEITKRLISDNEHIITRLIRPLSYCFILFCFVILVFFDGNLGGFAVNKAYIPVIENLLTVMTIFYFGSRGIEKVTKIRK